MESGRAKSIHKDRIWLLLIITTIPLTLLLSLRTVLAAGPVAGNDQFNTNEDQTLVETAPGVLVNDTPVTATAYLETAPVTGTLDLHTSGAFTYTPALNFNGLITFTYYIAVSGSLTDSARVTITVTAVNDPPVANSDTATTGEETPLDIPAPGVLANDNDPDNDPLSVIPADTSSAYGAAVTVTSNGGYTYDPTLSSALNALAEGESADDTFTYTIADTGGVTDTATVTITVNGVNDPPTAVADNNATNEDTILDVAVPGLLAGDSDPDTNDTLTAVSGSITSDEGAGVTINSSGSYNYNPTGAAALQALPTAGTFLVDTFEYTVTDGHGGEDTATVSITVTGRNDAPVLDNSGSLTLTNIDEDESAPGGDTVSSLIAGVISDPDNGALQGIAVVGANNSSGSWQYSTSGGANWLDFGSLDNSTAVLLAADSDTRIRFVPNPDYNGSSGNILFRAWDRTTGDNGNTGVNVSTNGGTTAYSSAVETATLTVRPINDAPALDSSGNMRLTNILEDPFSNPGDMVVSIISSAGGDRITDVDAGDPEGIAVTNADTANGDWQYSTDDGDNWHNFTVSPNAATLLNPQARIRFVSEAHYFGPAGNITFRAWDQSTGLNGQTGVDVSNNGGVTAYSSATTTATLTVIGVNDPPVLDLNGSEPGTGFSTTFHEDGGAVLIVSAGLSITDVDNTTLASAEAVLTNRQDGTAESLNVNTSGTAISANYNSTTGILTLSGSDSIAHYQTVLRTLAYNNSSQDPSPAPGRIVEVSVNDGQDESSVVTSFVSVIPRNDPPILDTNEELPVIEGGSNTISMARLLVTDVDNTPDERVFTIFTPPAHGTLRLDNSPISAGSTFTQADINNSLLDYDHDAGEQTSDFFTFTVADGSGGSIGLTTFNIAINAENDPPILAANNTLLLNEGATAVISNTLLRAADADNTPDELVFRVEVNTGSGTLKLNGSPLALNGTFTQDDVDNNRVTYAHNGSETTSDSFTFSVEDGLGGAIDSTPFDISITPVNDPPSVDLNGAEPGSNYTAVFVEDDGAVPIVANGLTVSDPDSTSLVSAVVTLTSLPDGTAESLNATTGSTALSANYNSSTGVLTLSGLGSLANYQTVLRTLTYNNTSQDPTPAARFVTIVVNDGTADSSTATSTITITPVNDPPSLSTNAGLTTDYAQSQFITPANLLVSDPDNSPSEIQFTVESVPANGQLKLNGVELADDDTFTQNDINNNRLTYTHDASNTESDNFTFSVADGSGGSISVQSFDIVIGPQPIVYLPIIFNNYIYGEPNNSACAAFGIHLNTANQFLPDDQEDWYKFTLDTTTSLTIRINDYAPGDGQMLVYTGVNCLPGSLKLIGHAPDISPSGAILLNGLAPGDYYVRVHTAVTINNPPPYTLTVLRP